MLKAINDFAYKVPVVRNLALHLDEIKTQRHIDKIIGPKGSRYNSVSWVVNGKRYNYEPKEIELHKQENLRQYKEFLRLSPQERAARVAGFDNDALENCRLPNPQDQIPEEITEAALPAVLSSMGIAQCETQDNQIVDAGCEAGVETGGIDCEAGGGGLGGGGGGGGGGGLGIGACGGLQTGAGACGAFDTLLGAISGCGAAGGGACGAAGGGGGGGGGLGGGLGGGGGGGGCDTGEVNGSCNTKQFSDQSNFTVGCETLTAVTNSVLNATNTISCIVNRKVAVSESNITNIQNQDIEFINSVCSGNFEVTQSADIKVITATQMTSNDYSEIVNRTQDTIVNSIDAIQEIAKTNKLFGDVPPETANRLLAEARTAVTDGSLSNKANENLVQTVARYFGEQNQIIRVVGSVVSGDCKFTQESYLDIATQTMLDSTTETFVENDRVRELASAIRTQQDVRVVNGSGLEAVVLIAGLTILGLGIAYFFFNRVTSEKSKINPNCPYNIRGTQFNCDLRGDCAYYKDRDELIGYDDAFTKDNEQWYPEDTNCFGSVFEDIQDDISSFDDVASFRTNTFLGY